MSRPCVCVPLCACACVSRPCVSCTGVSHLLCVDQILKNHFFFSRASENTASADVELSIFAAALQSFRWDTVLRPYPPMYADPQGSGGKNRDALLQHFQRLMSLHFLQDRQRLGETRRGRARARGFFSDMAAEDSPEEALLQWVLRRKSYALNLVDPMSLVRPRSTAP